MSTDYNRVIIEGHLTRDPEVRTTNSGSTVSDIGMAINRKYKDKNGNDGEETVFVDIAAWGRQGEIVAEYCQKGSPLFVEGRLKLDQWETQDGQKRSKLSIVAERVLLRGSKGEQGCATQAPTAPHTPPTGNGAADGGSLPF